MKLLKPEIDSKRSRPGKALKCTWPTAVVSTHHNKQKVTVAPLYVRPLLYLAMNDTCHIQAILDRLFSNTDKNDHDASSRVHALQCYFSDLYIRTLPVPANQGQLCRYIDGTTESCTIPLSLIYIAHSDYNSKDSICIFSTYYEDIAYPYDPLATTTEITGNWLPMRPHGMGRGNYRRVRREVHLHKYLSPGQDSIENITKKDEALATIKRKHRATLDGVRHSKKRKSSYAANLDTLENAVRELNEAAEKRGWGHVSYVPGARTGKKKKSRFTDRSIMLMAKLRALGGIAAAKIAPCLDVMTENLGSTSFKEHWGSETIILRAELLIHQMELMVLTEHLPKAVKISPRWDLSPQVRVQVRVSSYGLGLVVG